MTTATQPARVLSSTLPRRNGALSMTAVESSVGVIGIVESAVGLVAVRVGYQSVPEVAKALERDFAGDWRESSWFADQILAYTKGEQVAFDDVELDFLHVTGGAWTTFRDRVTQACRQVGYGQVAGYADLAESVGNPDAARAVGSVMARNCWPIVVPCHRIVRADGQLGGFSSPRGLDMKRDLLELEANATRRGHQKPL